MSFKLNPFQQEIVDNKARGALIVNAAAGSGKTATTKETIARMINDGVDPRKILAVTFTRKASREWQERIGASTIEGWGDRHIEALEGKTDVMELGLSPEEEQVFEFLVQWCTTIHAACYRLLKKFGDRRHPPSDKDNWAIRDLINDILEMRGWKELSYKNALACVSAGINSGWTIYDFEKNIGGCLEYGKDTPNNAASILAEVYKTYLAYMRKNNLIDFSMMTVDFLKLIENNENIRQRVQEMFDYVIVDEAQDTSRKQAKILFTIAENTGNIMFVGDPRQSLYRWRGAVPSIMEEEFGQHWEQFSTKSLPINYRSTKTIVELSNKLIARNYIDREQFLFPVQPREDAKQGQEFSLINTYDFEEMGSIIAKMIEVDGCPGDFFILSRTNAECDDLYTRLMVHGIPCVNLSGGSIVESSGVAKVLAYMKLAINYDNARNDLDTLCKVANIASDKFLSPINRRTHDDNCQETRPWIDCGCPITMRKQVDRAYSRFYGRKSIVKAGGWWGIEDQMTHTTRSGERIMYSYGAEDFVEFVKHLEEFSDNALECIDEILKRSIIPYMLHEEGVNASDDPSESAGFEQFETLKAFLKDDMTVQEALDKLDGLDFSEVLCDQKNSAVLMTVHKSKGLERRNVIVNTTRMPCPIPPVFDGQVRIETPRSFLEERNVFYVAITRAEEKVVLMQSATWLSKPVQPSPFIAELSLNLSQKGE